MVLNSISNVTKMDSLLQCMVLKWCLSLSHGLYSGNNLNSNFIVYLLNISDVQMMVLPNIDTQNGSIKFGMKLTIDELIIIDMIGLLWDCDIIIIYLNCPMIGCT
eukprot:383764_1